MIFDKTIYMVYLDDSFVGIAEDEGEGWEIAYEYTCGTSNVLLDDDVDRVWYDKINVNRFESSNKNVIDRQLDTVPFLCYDNEEAEVGAKKLNQLALEKERIEAKLRAMTL